MPGLELQTSERVGRAYDGLADHDMFAEFFEHSDFLNFGYWREDTRSQREACENLVDELLSSIPRQAGTVLDVGCGKGASTRHLTRYFAPELVTGINVSDAQLARCRSNAPGCTFLHMDATDLRFADESFDTVISVEAAFHFDPRQRFLTEAYRVLKPGGWLLIADILWNWQSVMQPAVNYVETPTHYRRRCLRAGFSSAQVRDVTEYSWASTAAALSDWALAKRADGEIGRAGLAHILRSIRRCDESLRHYVLAVCRKE